MSYGYGRGRGRRGGRGGGGREGGGERWSSDWEARDEQPRGGGGRGRHPPHLKGKEIGLWYAKRGGVKRAEAERNSRAVVQMDESREQHITQLLNSVQRDPSRDHNPSVPPYRPVKPEPSGHSYFDGDEPPEEPQKTLKVAKIEDVKVKVKEEEAELKIVEKEKRADGALEYLVQEVNRNPSLDEELKRDLQSKRQNSKYLDMLTFREKLPSYSMKEELVKLIQANRVVVVSGETGCGKTTQVTQFILDDYIQRSMGSLCRVACTQPRRISAISVAERVAAERAESVGEGKSCGYQIRLQSRLPRKQGSVLYCTTGIILQWLRSDPCLSSISHLVLDEIHERSLHSDVLLTIVKDLLRHRDDLKVVLMSATLNAQKFSQYFDDCPMIHIPGHTYPVKEYLLEDVLELLRFRPPQQQDRRPRYRRGFINRQNLQPEKQEKEEEYKESWPCFTRTLRDRFSDSTIEALEMIDEDDKINLELIVALIRHIVLNEDDGAILVFLPGWDNISSLNDLLMAEQMFKSALINDALSNQVFKRPPPGVRKIVIATNIAETSITIDDVVYVIDGGKIKETHFDTQNNISTMTAEWVSLANAKQRKGRAGRVSPGKCYHLYNGLRASLLEDYQLPEIQRTPLEELCLQIKNALDRNEELTPLGVHLARLPVEPHIGKMILFGALLACLDPVLTIAASLSFKDPFSIPLGKEKIADYKRKILSKNTKSDHLTVVNAFQVKLAPSAACDVFPLICSVKHIIISLQGWEEAKRRGYRYEREYCWDNFLSANTLQMLQNMKVQFAEHLLAAGFVSSKDPKHPNANINSGNTHTPACKRAELRAIFLYDCTEVSPFSLLFFGGEISIQKDQEQDTIAVDEWIVFQSPARIAHLVKNLKKELDLLLEEKIKRPCPVDWSDRTSKDCAVISAIIDLITTQESTAPSQQPYRKNHQNWD
ncbi:ATP-dependent RNA helicase DHX36 [Bagarius yarrelli]|uniref:ATP-dependent DNA/RNA helicase DHX36 n=1 Tax=Bagarius yarrelli TaxID=175774 RepID=A0A556TQM4_BAGYA|nr:ATP-dependent RNA helicase DHX36 [Bagarius yarrelli]